MFRRRDEDEIEYTLTPATRNNSNSGFHAASQAPGQTINSQAVTTTTHAPNNMPYNPAASFAQNLVQAQNKEVQAPEPKAASYGRSVQTPAPQENITRNENIIRNEITTPKETKTSTPKTVASMNTFVPSAIRSSSNAGTNQPSQPAQAQSQAAPAQTQPQAASPKQQALKVDNIGLETERRLTVGYGISLEGKVSDCDKLVIYGNVNAELNNVKALQISDSGCFRGAAEIDYAEISGVFEGEIRVRKNIVISSTGRVSGKITYNSIEIKPGGKFTGEIIEAKSEMDVASGQSENDGSDLSLFAEQKAENRAA